MREVRQTHRRFLRALARASSAATSNDHQASQRLVPIRDVSRASNLSLPETVRALRRLERDGLVEVPSIGWVRITFSGLLRARGLDDS